MKNMKYRIIAVLLALTTLVVAIPTTAFAVGEDAETEATGGQENVNQITSRETPEYLEVSDGYISVKVSTSNGGFYVGTEEGDVIIKSDNDKHLMYNDSDFDTSFTTFRVTKAGQVTDYIFGRSYDHLGVESSEATRASHAVRSV